MLKLFSPAKLNLFLHVVRKRPDGYHDLASLFQTIDFGDYLTITPSEKDFLTISGPYSEGLPCDESNLILKALSLFRNKTGLGSCFHFHLEKNLPLQAGLGGGSSNAATALWGINQLCGHPASLSNLIEWSGEIGSDITFFLSQGTAYCTSRGEIMQLMPELPLLNHSLYLVKPINGLSTPAVFKHLKQEDISQKFPEQILHRFYQGSPNYFNELETPAFRADPELRTIKQSLLDAGFHTVAMTGTGTSFFCLGNVTPPHLPGLLVKKTHFLRRSSSEWYSKK